MMRVGPVDLLSLEEVYDVQHHALKTSAKFRLNDSLKVTATAFQPSNRTSVCLETKSWSVAHDVSSKNTMFKYNAYSGSRTKLTLSQMVPQGKWFLVPSPTMKVTRKGLPGMQNNVSIEGTWSMLDRAGSSSVKLYPSSDRTHKLEAIVKTGSGPTFKARSKLRQGILHSISASTSQSSGPQLALKSRFNDNIKTKTSYDIRKKALRFEAKRTTHGDKDSANDPSTITRIEVLAPVVKGGLTPRLIVGIKWFN